MSCCFWFVAILKIVNRQWINCKWFERTPTWPIQLTIEPSENRMPKFQWADSYLANTTYCWLAKTTSDRVSVSWLLLGQYNGKSDALLKVATVSVSWLLLGQYNNKAVKTVKSKLGFSELTPTWPIQHLYLWKKIEWTSFQWADSYLANTTFSKL